MEKVRKIEKSKFESIDEALEYADKLRKEGEWDFVEISSHFSEITEFYVISGVYEKCSYREEPVKLRWQRLKQPKGINHYTSEIATII